MNKLTSPLLFLLFLLPFGIGAQSSYSTGSFIFYDQELFLSENSQRLPVLSRFSIEEVAMRRAYQQLRNSNYQPWLADIQALADRLQLNDWLYCELVSTAVLAHYKRTTPNPQTNLTTYFLLAESGFDVRLTYRDQRVFINIYTEDELFEVPLIQEAGRAYANISMMQGEESRMRQSMFLLDHHPNPRGRACSFLLQEWPRLFLQPQTRTIAFQYYGLTMEVDVRYNAGIPKLLESYPLVSEQWYLDAPLSNELHNSLVTSLKKMIAGMNEGDALALIASFTRSSFDYKNDNEVFGTNKPMVGDELFYYPYSDCEDRSALFYGLVREILGLPMLVIAYDDHLTIAVATDQLSGDVVRYQGKRYVFVDPTGPSNSSEIGNIPSGYENKSFEIIGTFSGDQRP